MSETIYKFKLGDCVKLKDGIEPEPVGETTVHWQGRIVAFFEEENVPKAIVEYDLLSQSELDEEYWKFFRKGNRYYFHTFVPCENLALTEPRDTSDEVEEYQDELMKQIWEESNYEIDERSKTTDTWLRHFMRSQFCFDLDSLEMENAPFIVENFIEYMYQYEGQTPNEWDDDSVNEVCVHWIPSKVSAEKEIFECFGNVMLHFFEFLEDKKYLATQSFQEIVKNVKDKVLENSQDPALWGPAKTMVMAAMEAGVDMQNQEEMNKFVQKMQQRTLSEMEQERQNKLSVIEELSKMVYEEDTKNAGGRTTTKSIGRNEKVSVLYKDGKVVNDVKYKKVEQDLKSGLCVLN